MKKTVLYALCAALIAAAPLRANAEGDAVHCTFVNTEFDSTDPAYSGLVNGEEDTSCYINAWQSETVYLKAAVTADADTHIRVSIEAPKGVKQSDQPAAKAGLLKPVSAGLGMGTDPYVPHISVYDSISDETETDLAAGETAYVWAEITANAESSGRYDGALIIEADREYRLPIELVVTPIDLNGYTPSVDLWQYPYASYFYYEGMEEPFSEAHTAALRRELALYREAGGSHITCTITDEPWAHQTYYDNPSLVKWNRDGVGNLWFDYSRFDAWVSLCESEGIAGPIDCFSILPFDNDIVVYDDMDVPFRLILTPGTEEWRFYWETFLYSFTAHLNEKGWLDRTILFVDERGIPYFQTAIDLARSVPEGSRLKFAAAVNVIPRDTALYDQIGYLAIAIPSVPEGDAEFDAFLAHRRELGLETTLYNCSTNFPNAFMYSDPCESVWTMQYLAMRGFDGYLRWALNAWPQDPLICSDAPHFESGDTFLIYPDEHAAENPEPTASVRLRMIMRGLNDARKYRILLDSLPEADSASLRQLFEGMERPGGMFNAYGAMSAVSDEQRASIAAETLRNEEGIRKAALIAAVSQRGGKTDRASADLNDFVSQYQDE